MEPKAVFKFEMNQRVALSMSGEYGVVIGRAEYLDLAPQYYIRYVDGTDRQVQDWIPESALTAL
ncbi:hypothetical protein HDIA_0790 [Hartmannibacter diazotrophicus]|uniref:Uncharacterized protein n=1 Tax=Hartmannibacter diazotrophicus TaxID=1482074 RepID=A0A2C9D3G4_9HYPH|nr:hypothetical protein [Hartmannibacter diazotrophicus]SON54331.1 hypothetical protein HDIA_0790 [Hartmannibacter diazotrophicus]